MDFLTAVDVAAGLGRQIKEAGLAWELLPPAQAEAALADMKQRGADQNIWLDPSMVQLTSENYFMLCFRNDGVPIAKMSARIDLVTEGFNMFAERMLRTIYREHNGVPSAERFPNEVAKLNGKIAYIGDLAVMQRILLKGNQPLSPVIMALLFVTIDQKWGAPDHIVCWTRPAQRVAKALGPAWTWVSETGSFSQPGSSTFRGYNLGILSKSRFQEQLEQAASLAAREGRGTIPPRRDASKSEPTDNHDLAHS